MKLALLDSPSYREQMYTLYLYCKYQHETDFGVKYERDNDYTGDTRADCYSQARKDGWILHVDGTSTCPECRRLK